MTAYTQERWFKMLVDATASEPRGNQGMAERLGISRTQVSLVLSGQYKNPTRIAEKTLALLDNHPCPYLGMAVSVVHCIEVNSGPVPTWDPAALDQRRCCQTCPHKPNATGEAQ